MNRNRPLLVLSRGERFVHSSLQALDEAGNTSSSLRFFANKLLDVKDN